jgi:hypothetical protein
MVAGVLGPFGGIEIAEVDDPPGKPGTSRYWAIGPENATASRMPSRATTCHPGGEAGIAVIRQAEGLAGERPRRLAILAGADRGGPHGSPRTTRRAVDVLDVVRMIDEGAEEHPVPPRQLAQDVEGADLVALVGRKGMR